jgi:hypothetical protein
MRFSPGCSTMLPAQQFVNLCARHSPFDRGLPFPEHHESLPANGAVQFGAPIGFAAIRLHRTFLHGRPFAAMIKR